MEIDRFSYLKLNRQVYSIRHALAVGDHCVQAYPAVIENNVFLLVS